MILTDDIPRSIPRAQSQLTRTADAAANLGLIMSAPKTEYMTINCRPQPPLQVYGNSINHFDFRYLGSSTSDLKRRKGLAWAAFWKLYNACGNVLTSQYINQSKTV